MRFKFVLRTLLVCAVLAFPSLAYAGGFPQTPLTTWPATAPSELGGAVTGSYYATADRIDITAVMTSGSATFKLIYYNTGNSIWEPVDAPGWVVDAADTINCPNKTRVARVIVRRAPLYYQIYKAAGTGVVASGRLEAATNGLGVSQEPAPPGVIVVGTVTVAGGLTDTQLRTTPVAISATALPLPTGAATNATLTGGTVRVKLTDGVDNADVKAAFNPALTSNAALVVAVSPNNVPVLPAGAATNAILTGGTQTTRITDGTNTATVKAASTAAGASDKAVVVAVSPNNTVAVSMAAVATGGATAANQTAANTTLATIATNTTDAATGAKQTTGNASLATIATNSGTAITPATTPTLSLVAMTTTGAQVWAAAPTAKVRKIHNQDTNDNLWCVYYDGVTNVTSISTMHFVVLPGQVWEMPNFPGVVEYTGPIRCALKSSTGNINALQAL